MGQDATMDALLGMVEQCSNKCLQYAIDKNERLIGELLIKMIVKSKYDKTSIDNILHKNKSNHKQYNKNKNKNNNSNKNKSQKRRKKQLKTLFKSLTKSTYQPRKQSRDDNDNSDSTHIGFKNINLSKNNSKQSKETLVTNGGIDQVVACDTDKFEMNDINRELGLFGNSSENESNSDSNINYDINTISDDSLKIVLLFLNPFDIYFTQCNYIFTVMLYNHVPITSRTTYTVSKRFNLLLKQIHSSRNILHTIVPGHHRRLVSI